MNEQWMQIPNLLVLNNPRQVYIPLKSIHQTNCFILIYIPIRFGFVGFYNISTLVGNLMATPIHTYILNVYFFIFIHIY